MRHQLSFSRRQGFTIVELLIVIVVIGILATVAVLAYNGVIAASRDNAALSDADAVASEVARYGTKNSGTYGSAVEWYSGAGTNANIDFTPSEGNIIDVVANSTDYCVRVYNPGGRQYSTLDTAAKKGSSNSACDTLSPSTAAQDATDPHTYASITWTQRTSAGLRAWSAVASSADGTKLAAAHNGGYIHTSSDGGVTWTQRTSSGSRAWYSLASSADGTKLAATVDGGYIYTSTDSGATWTQRTSAGSRQWWGKIAMSADGSKLVAAPSWGHVYTSADGGATWTERTGPSYNNWRGFAMSADGNTIVGVAMSNPVWVSTDGGANWTSQTVGTVQWSAVTISSDGSKMAMAPTGNQGPVHTSTNTGATWVSRPSSTNDCYYGLTSSSNGTKLAAATSMCGNGYIRLSKDSGVTWTQDQSMGRADWIDIAGSTNGAKLIIAAKQRYTGGSFVANGYIFTGEYN